MSAPTPESGRGSADRRDGTVSRIARVLAAVADGDDSVGLADVAKTSGLPTSTSHRLLALLRAEGLVDIDLSRRYVVGPELFRIASRVIDRFDIAPLAREVMAPLAERFDETVLLSRRLPAKNAIMFIARADGRQDLQYRIDLHHPVSMAWGASGKAVLAFLSDAEVDEVLDSAEPSPATRLPLPPRDVVLAELERIRERGYAYSEGETLVGARGLAVPVFGPRGVIGSLCLTSPMDRLTQPAVASAAPILADAAAELSRLLGAPDRRP